MALERYSKQVSGKDKGDILLFALSTCGWCRKTKDLLHALGVRYKYIDVDLLEGETRRQVFEELDHWDPGHTFPAIVINNKKCIVGFQEEKIRKALGSGQDRRQ